MSATFIAVVVDIAIGLLALRQVRAHKSEDAVVHEGFNKRLAGLEGLATTQVVGFAPAAKKAERE